LDNHIRFAVYKRAAIINTTEQLKTTTECKEGFLMSHKNYGGIDVAKKDIVIGIFGQEQTKTEANTAKGHAKAVAYLKKHNVDLVVLESTGGLEVPLANALHAAGMRVVIANPQRTHKYAGSFSPSKSDHLDAKMLADYAQALDARKLADDMCYVPPSEEVLVLEALVKRRGQLVTMRTMEKNRLKQTHVSQQASVRALIEHLSEQIAALDKEIDKNNRDGFGGKGEILKDVPGVGKITCATILSMLPELGRVRHKRAALLVGVVVPSLQSGEKEGKRGCVGGRMAVRNALYMAALTATRKEPKIQIFFERLINRGKAFKVAINACMHKLLRILNARMRDYLASLEKTEETEPQSV